MLEDEDVRQGIKEYANWPTIPQLYVNGEFVGGSDIMMEMYQAGELQQLLTRHRHEPPLRALTRPGASSSALTGATGAVYGVRLLQRARALGVETHLVATPAGVLNVHHELGLDRKALEALADHSHTPGRHRRLHRQRQLRRQRDGGRAVLDEDAGRRSPTACRDNLLTRAADVTLKERRRLVLMVRETPFNLAHLRNMTAVTEMGAIVFPPLPAFYHRPRDDRRAGRRHRRARAGPARRRRRRSPRPGRACSQRRGADQRRAASARSQSRRAANTAFGYSGRPRLPL